jgi:hypothetical protein
MLQFEGRIMIRPSNFLNGIKSKMKRIFLLLILTMMMLSAACSTPASATPAAVDVATVAPTLDLCSAENLPDEVAKVNKLMREFDDYSALASNTPQAQLINLIPEMQRILRDAEDVEVPACLQTLKKLELAHMNLVIQILMAFLNSANAQVDAQAINAGIGQARELHAKYDIELARLLGITLVAPATVPAVTADPNATPATSAVIAYVTNLGASSINLRTSPALDAPEAGQLAIQSSTAAVGKSADAQWIKVEIPGQPQQTAWVFASLVQLSIPIEQLPVVE